MNHPFEIIHQLKDQYPIKILCKVLDVSRSGYYAYIKRPNRDEKLEKLIFNIFHQHKGTRGYRSITLHLRQDYQLRVNHKRVKRIMDKQGLKAVIRKKKQSRSYSGQTSAGHKYENILQQDFHAENPREKLATDVTEFKVVNTTLYLSAIKDLYNHEIVAYHLSPKNNIALVEATIEDAFKKIGTDTTPILHSDQGMQYRSNRYQQLSKEYNFTPSMSRKGNCFDNAPMESFFSHFKAEAFLLYPCETVEEAYETVKKYIYYYNHRRYQQGLNGMAPVQYLQPKPSA